MPLRNPRHILFALALVALLGGCSKPAEVAPPVAAVTAPKPAPATPCGPRSS